MRCCVGAASKAIDADEGQLDDQQGLGMSFADRINSRLWKPSGMAHDFVVKPLEPGTPWDDPYALELARGRNLGARMQVDSVPDTLSRGDMHLYEPTDDWSDGDRLLTRKGTVWHPVGAVRYDAAIASMLVMGPDGDADTAPTARGTAFSA